MSVLFSPFGNSQYLDENGAPAVGYTVTTYAAGSSTALASYTSSTGLVPNANPTTLNAAGLNPNGQFWLTSGLSYKFIIKDAGGVEVDSVDGVTGVNDPAVISTSDQWVAYSGTPTYISATSFSVAGDQTGTFQVGRRVKSTNSGGTVYSTVFSSTFGAVTTVVLINDSGTLDIGLSAVSYGLLSASSSSVPQTVFAPMAECRLTKSGANLLLSPLNGNRLTINGVVYKIPSAGVTLAPPATTLTLYYIYAFMTAGVMTLEASTTTHATDTTTGMEIKSADATRTLVGMGRTVASAWVDSATQRFVVSYFNRRRIRLMAANVSVSGFNTTDVERTPSNRCEFLTWADDAVRFGTNGYIGNNLAGGINNSARGNIDGGTGTYAESIHWSSAANSIAPIGWSMVDTLTEGYHYSSLNAFTGSGSGGVVSAQNWAEIAG